MVKFELFKGDCLDVLTTGRFQVDYLDLSVKAALNNAVQLALFSTPYPGLLGFDVSIKEYLSKWLPSRLSKIVPLLKDPTAVIVQNIWFPRTEKGFYDQSIFKIPDLYWSYGLSLIDPYIWDKKNSPPSGDHGRYDRNEWEFCFAFALSPDYTYHKFRKPYADKTTGKAATGNMRKPDLSGQLAGGHSNLHPEGAGQSNILRFSSSGDQGRPRIEDRVFPRGLAERIILQFSDPGDLVLDPFCGSGTTLAMALKHDRYAIGIDINEENLKVADEWLKRDFVHPPLEIGE